MNEEDIQKARQVAIHDLLGIKQTGRRVSVRCVFHTDKNPSLVIYPSGGGYHCFSCGANGHNAIDFCMGLGLTFKEAVNQLKDF